MTQPTFHNVFRDLIEGVKRVVKEMGRAVIDLTNSVNSALKTMSRIVFDWIIDVLQKAFNVLCEIVNHIIQIGEDILKTVFAPITFASKATDWSHNVAAPMGRISYAVTDTELISEDLWSGVGARAYKKAVGDQTVAAQKLADVGDKMSECLDSCSNAGWIFQGAVLVALSTAGAGIYVSIAGASTGAGIIPAIITALASQKAALVAIGAAIGAYTKLMVSEATAINNMQRALDSFPYGEWPAATKD